MPKNNILKKVDIKNIQHNILSITHNDPLFLIFSQKELKRMLDYSEMTGDNIVLVYDPNSIGTTYGITSQNTWNTFEHKTDIGLLDITDDSNW